MKLPYKLKRFLIRCQWGEDLVLAPLHMLGQAVLPYPHPTPQNLTFVLIRPTPIKNFILFL